MNNVVLIGRLTKDPELRYTPGSQTAVTHMTIAVDRPVRQGEEKQADFIRITVFGRQAETADRYLSRGRQVAVQGRVQTGSYKDRDDKTVYTTDIVAERVEFIGGGQSAGNAEKPSEKPKYGRQEQVEMYDIPDGFAAAGEDIPF